MTARQIVLFEAPSNLGLMPPAAGKEPGVRHMPDALRRAGFHDLLRPARIVRIDAPPYDADESRTVNIRNMAAIGAYSSTLADAIGDALARGEFPLVIGGDCTILIGATLALKRRGAHGLVYVDGHTDFFLPEQSGTGGAAGMDLALATGFGPDALADIEGLKPYIDVAQVAMLANRDRAKRKRAAIPAAAESGMVYRALDRLRADGIAATVDAALAAILTPATQGFWVHYDVDALDSAIMPAVDSPQPDGLSFAEAEELIGAALADRRALGLQATIFDPDLDPDGALARALSAHLLRILR